MSDFKIIQLLTYGDSLLALDKDGNVWKMFTDESMEKKWEIVISCDQLNFLV